MSLGNTTIQEVKKRSNEQPLKELTNQPRVVSQENTNTGGRGEQNTNAGDGGKCSSAETEILILEEIQKVNSRLLIVFKHWKNDLAL